MNSTSCKAERDVLLRKVCVCVCVCFFWCTLPKTNIAPTNGWLEDYFPFGKVTFQGRTVKLQVGSQGIRFFSCREIQVCEF